jgi:hypothetical protein
MYHSIYNFWNIGRLVWKNRNYYLNPVEKFSIFFSYFYGSSNSFSRDDIKIMRRFYLDFPIFYNDLNKITWAQYKEILVLKSKEERYFYFFVSLFFSSNLNETKDFINNNYFHRI